MPHLTGAQFLADSLHAQGVTHVFFVPAILSHTLAELDRRTPIQRILTHGEKSAVYMADGYARASRRVGVSFAQCIGAANLAAGLRDPYLACSPLVVLTGGPYVESRSRHVYQEIEDYPLFKPLTKYSARVDTLARLPDTLRQAFRAATTSTPGPAHLELAGHLGELEREAADLEVIAEPQFGQVPPLRIAPDPQAVREAAQILEAAQRPIIVAGGGARTSDAGAGAARAGRAIGDSSRHLAQCQGSSPWRPSAQRGSRRHLRADSANHAVLAADLVFFIGSHTGSQVTAKWRVPRPGTTVIQLDINPAELGRHYPNRVSLWGDAKLGLRMLIESSDAGTAGHRRGWVEQVQTLAREWRGQVAPQMESDAVPIRPERICRELSRHLPDDAIVVSETGHAGMWTGAIARPESPQPKLYPRGGLAGLGSAGGAGSEIGCPTAACAAVLRRWRLLVSPQ